MREIKFRAKNNKDKWSYGEFAHDSIGNAFLHFWDDKEKWWTHSSVDEKTLGQFTGLKDKNEKEIYEGDLVDTGAKQGRIKFLYGCWHFVDGENAYLLYPKEEGYGSGGKWKYIEVIGNIYESPELLKN